MLISMFSLTLDWPMYSRRFLGRRLSSNDRSSARGIGLSSVPRSGGVRSGIVAPSLSGESSQALPQKVFERSIAGGATRDPLERLLGGGSRVTEVDQRRHHVLPDAVGAARRARLRGLAGAEEGRDLSLQLEHDALGGLTPHAGDRGELRQVARRYGPRQLLDAGAREYRDRDLRPDAADRDQLQEEILLALRSETVQDQRVLAHVRVDPERNLASFAGKVVEGRDRDVDLVTNSLDVDEDQVGLLREQAT